MSVMPALKPLFDAIAASPSFIEERDPGTARIRTHALLEANVLRFYSPQSPVALERDYAVPAADGHIAVRIYSNAATAERPLPCHLYFHGGSFWLGKLEHFDSICRQLARDAGCIVAAVDYRLAPEFKFPTAAEDCYAALGWIVEHATLLGVDPARITVGGMSAGGNLAAVTTLMARDRGGPVIALQVLEVPILDLARTERLLLPREGISLACGKEVVLRYYLATASDASHPYASPLCAVDLRGLPPALVMCAEYDPLAAEGLAYARRLALAHGEVEYECWPGQFHGSQAMSALIPEEAAAYQFRIARALRRAHG